MPLFLKNIAPELDIFGNRQIFNFNKDPSLGESDSALSLINWFAPIPNVNANSTFEFLTPVLKGFRFNHSLSTTGTFGNFNFEKYDRFGLATPLWSYNELTNSLNFLTNLSIFGSSTLTTNDSIYSLILNNTNSAATANGILTQLNGSSSSAFGFNNSTNEAYAWAYGTSSLKFGTANTKRMQLLNNGTLDLLTNDLITTGNISAQTGTLKGNNLAAYNSGSIFLTSSLAMNNNYITGLPNPLNSQDVATKQYVDNSSGGTAQSILHGYNNSTYSTNVGVGDHIKFDGNVFVRGSNISLDTSSSYSTSTNVASVGRITLAAGKTYRLTGSINNVVSANYNGMRWYNSDTNTALGVQSGMPSPVSTTDRVPSTGFVAFITTSVSTRVELRITWNALSSVNGTGDGIGPTWFTVEEV